LHQISDNPEETHAGFSPDTNEEKTLHILTRVSEMEIIVQRRNGPRFSSLEAPGIRVNLAAYATLYMKLCVPTKQDLLNIHLHRAISNAPHRNWNLKQES